jgi:hypothetical protein
LSNEQHALRCTASGWQYAYIAEQGVACTPFCIGSWHQLMFGRQLNGSATVSPVLAWRLLAACAATYSSCWCCKYGGVDIARCVGHAHPPSKDQTLAVAASNSADAAAASDAAAAHQHVLHHQDARRSLDLFASSSKIGS